MKVNIRGVATLKPIVGKTDLTAHIPHCEADVLVFNSFNIETCKWNELKVLDNLNNRGMEQLTPMTVLQTTIAKTTTWNNMEQHLSQPTVATTSLTIQHPTLFIKTLQNNCMISHDYYLPSVNIRPYQSSPRWH